MADVPVYATALARAFLAGEWERNALAGRGREVFGRRPRFLGRLVSEVLELYHRPPLDRPRELAEMIGALLRRSGVRRVPPVRHWWRRSPPTRASASTTASHG